MRLSAVILGAGKGSRMKSAQPKVLHEIGHLPMVFHVLNTARAFGASRIVAVIGHGRDQIEAALAQRAPEVQIAVQEAQLGTAHAVDQAHGALADRMAPEDDMLVLYGDTPFVTLETMRAMQAARQGGADLVVLGFEAADPTGYGRLICDESGAFLRIVEQKDATPEEAQTRLCNSGVIYAKSALLFDLIKEVGNENANGEYYLTDTIALARAKGFRAEVVLCAEAETLGVNSRADLARAEAIFQEKKRAEAMAAGVTLIDPKSVTFAYDTQIGADTIIEPHVVFGPNVRVGQGVRLRGFSHCEGCVIGDAARIGPYARLRPGADLADHTHIGNFVEIKAAQIATGAKVNHLSYIGDAEIGAAANIGAGTITCNYDGVFKHKTTIGARAFIGSNTALVAPVTIGEEAMTGSGAVITRDVPAGDLALARAKQENKPGLARKFMARLRALKAKASV